MLSSTPCAVGGAAAWGAPEGRARPRHAPAVAGGVPALHGLVAALLVTLGLVGSDLGGSSRCGLGLAFGLDQSG